MVFRTANTLNVTLAAGNQGYYGAFYSSLDQSDGVNTPNAFFCENTFDADGISMVVNGSGKKTQMTFAHAGTYNIQFSTVFNYLGGGGNGKEVDIWFKLNGNNVANSNTRINVTSSAPYVVASWNFVISVAAGDYVEIFWMTDNANIVAEHLDATATVPATPSVIMTATQVR